MLLMGDKNISHKVNTRSETRLRGKVVHSPIKHSPFKSYAGNSKTKTAVNSESKFIAKESQRKSSNMEQELAELKERLAGVEAFRNLITELEDRVSTGQVQVRELREQNELQREKIRELERGNNVRVPGPQNVAPMGDNAMNVNLLGNFLNGFQRLNTDYRRPEFDNQESQNPREFINRLERYFGVVGTREETKLIVAEDSLKGLAKLWLDARVDSFATYEEFKNSFLEVYDSATYRMKAKLNWSLRRYNPRVEGLQEYFLKQLKEAKYIFPDISVKAINTELAQQFPENIRASLATADFADNEIISNALAYLDLGSDARYRQKTNRDIPENNHRNREGIRNMDVMHDRHYEENNAREQYNGRQGFENQQVRANAYHGPQNYHRGRGRGGNFGNRQGVNAGFVMPDLNRPPPNVNYQNQPRNARDLN